MFNFVKEYVQNEKENNVFYELFANDISNFSADELKLAEEIFNDIDFSEATSPLIFQ